MIRISVAFRIDELEEIYVCFGALDVREIHVWDIFDKGVFLLKATQQCKKGRVRVEQNQG